MWLGGRRSVACGGRLCVPEKHCFRFVSQTKKKFYAAVSYQPNVRHHISTPLLSAHVEVATTTKSRAGWFITRPDRQMQRIVHPHC
jgi:hypothetical protein